MNKIIFLLNIYNIKFLPKSRYKQIKLKKNKRKEESTCPFRVWIFGLVSVDHHDGEERNRSRLCVVYKS